MTSPSSASPDGHGARLDAQSIRFERLLPGPIERVWAWLADADKRARWLAGGERRRATRNTTGPSSRTTRCCAASRRACWR
ncbi:Uncharacterised protein [Bordetella pertussis]|nr:Uncharacterised protein [Bordetella pertussis]